MEGKIEETEFSVKGNEGELNNLFTELCLFFITIKFLGCVDQN